MGGGGGGGGRDVPPSRDKSPVEAKVDEIARKIEEKSDLTYLQNLETQIKNFVEEEMNKFSNKIPWDHNDHSINHIDRVLEKLPEIINNFEKISYSEEFLQGDKLSDLDKEILKYAIFLHDIGYSQSIKDHSIVSREYIEKLNRGIKESILKDVATIAQLHTPEGLRELNGTSLRDLVEKGHISDRIAYLASILIISDALDAGKQRVMQNSQGAAMQSVIDKIKSQFAPSIAERKLEHWYGHQGFGKPNLERSDNNLRLSFELDTNLSSQYSSIIAFRVLDIITDITNSHLISSSKFKLDLDIKAKNLDQAKNWFNENRILFQNEEKLSNDIRFIKIQED